MRRIPILVLAAAVGLSAVAPAASAQTAPPGFSDVADDHPRKADIDYAVARGWFQGYEDGTFKPDRIVTAADIAALTGRVFGEVSEEGVIRFDMALFMQHGNQALTSPVPATVTPPAFSDFPPEEGNEIHERVFGAVGYAAARGWFLGYPDGTFRPERVISAAQITNVVGRAFAGGVSRAEMAAFVRHGNQAVVAHEASLAWDRVEAAGEAAQAAWNNVCEDYAGFLNSNAVLQLIAAGHTAEIAAEDAVADAWRADVVFWETLADRSEAENEALAKAKAAAAAWDKAAADERRLLETWSGDLGTEAGRAAAAEAGWAARASEEAAWDAVRGAAKAAQTAENRAEKEVRDAWNEAADKSEAAYAIWSSFPPLTDLAAACRTWVDAWIAWDEWASAMSIANDALAAIA